MQQAEMANFNVIAAPSLDIIHGDKDQYLEIEKKLMEGMYEIAIFSSATAVEECFSEWGSRFSTLFVGVHVVAIGPRTRSALLSHGIEAVSMPCEYTSFGLVRYMDQYKGKKVLVIHSDKGSPVLKDGLIDAGFSVDELMAYFLRKHRGDVDNIKKAVLEGVVDVFAFTSRMSVESFIDAIEMPVERVFGNKIVAAIGAPTKFELEARGVHVDIVPHKATFSDLLESIAKYFYKQH
ncbi:MAG: uroporphyrinogen-III synthase [archaeon]|nr:uroporphyrinogen-III synthase [archaeon]